MSEQSAVDGYSGPNLLTWSEAVDAMRHGALVRRNSQMLNMPAPKDGISGYETAQDACYLAAAWSVEDEPVRVFMWATSKTLFIPDGEHISATDWRVVL